jgi:PAS domain S-box-containing protein
MTVLTILLLQVLIYVVFPFYFTTLPYHLRSIAFYIYLSVLYILGGFLGAVYTLPITESISISGGNLNYGAFMMTIILLVIIESDLDIVRHVLRLVLGVNVFKLLIYYSLSLALANEAIINPYQTAAKVFDVSIDIVAIGGTLIMAELLIFLLIFSWVKRWVKNIGILAILYIFFYLFILMIDGLLFPLFAFAANSELVNTIYGNITGKIVMGSLYCIPMLAFILLNRQRFVAFVEKPMDLSELLKSSRRALQIALQDSERRYRLLVDSSPYAIAIYQHEKIVFANEAACRLIGVEDYHALLNKSFLSIVPAENHKQSQDAFESILHGEDGNSRTFEQEILKVDGKRVPVEITAVLINYQGDMAIQIIAKDISERKQAEAAARQATRLQHELAKERELAELKIRFTSMIVHDFRNPVATIVLSSDMIQHFAQNTEIEKVQEKANRIGTVAMQLNSQIDNLLELGHAEAALINFSPRVQDIIDFCRDVFSSVEQANEGKGHEFGFESALKSQNLSFDSHLMERMLNNLLTNAVKYSPNAGKVQMKLRKADDSLEIIISDSGIGIPQEDIDHIFDFFYRASNVSKIQGTGIGLAIVKQIVEKHGGTIRYESEIEKGTSLIINLPIGLN